MVMKMVHVLVNEDKNTLRDKFLSLVNIDRLMSCHINYNTFQIHQL